MAVSSRIGRGMLADRELDARVQEVVQRLRDAGTDPHVRPPAPVTVTFVDPATVRPPGWKPGKRETRPRRSATFDPRRCEHCHESYVPRAATQRFCNVKCRDSRRNRAA
jgi:hypothetical protein